MIASRLEMFEVRMRAFGRRLAPDADVDGYVFAATEECRRALEDYVTIVVKFDLSDWSGGVAVDPGRNLRLAAGPRSSNFQG